jgi:branched-chain amino acid transport system substrate-binding protein
MHPQGVRSAVSRTVSAAIIIIVIIVAGIVAYSYYQTTLPQQSTTTTTQQQSSISTAQNYVTLGLSIPTRFAVGQDAQHAADMAVSEINANGGVLMNGTHYLLRTVTEDTNEMDWTIPVDQGLSALDKLVTVDGAQIILGGVRTDVVVAQTTKLPQYKVVFVDVESNQPISECMVRPAPKCPPTAHANYTLYKYYFHLFVNGSAIGPSLVQFPIALRAYAKSQAGWPNISNVAILAENALWTVGPVGRPAGNSSFVRALQSKGFNIVYAQLFPLNTQDFSTYLSQIAASKAGLIVLFFSGTDGVSFAQQWKSYNWPNGTRPFVYGPGLLGGFSYFWDQSNGAAQGMVPWPSTVNESFTPKTVPFINAFTKKYGHTPNTMAMDMYDAVYVVKQAMEIANSWKADKLIPALESLTYTGVIGTIHFTSQHGINLPQVPMYQQFGQWQNGVLVPIWKTGQQNISSRIIKP